MTKLLENIYRCVNISLANELKQFCLWMGLNIFEVIDATKTNLSDSRPSISALDWAAVVFQSILFISPGRPSSSTSIPVSSSSPERLTWLCLIRSSR
jgi:hypothetical protein